MNSHLIGLVGWGLFLLVTGYYLPFIRNKSFARTTAWSLVVFTALFSTILTDGASALFRMLAIVSLQLLSMKVVVWVESTSEKPALSFVQWLAFAQGWFGMRPLLFGKLVSRPLAGSASLLIKGVSRIVLGLFLLYVSASIQQTIYVLSALLMLVGLSLILHFGVLNISTAFWRWLGVDVKELFRSPYQAKSLREFWGRRWNLAFSEMTALVAYRPLKGALGVDKAMFASFLLSGLLHEMAISLPVKSGYGLPLLYFVIHGLVMEAEGKMPLVKRIITHPILSHGWVMTWLILPLPLLFHHAFIQEVITPLRNNLLNFINL
jgi:hypothetical protein